MAPYVIDLHAHLPMQFDPASYRQAFRRHKGSRKLIDKIRFAILEFADKYFNRERPSDGHAVTLDTLLDGNVGVALSVAYCPFDEIDLDEGYAAPPEDGYFRSLHNLLRVVEDHVRADPRAQIVRNFVELQAARAQGKLAIVHAVEGGFHLGGRRDTIIRNVETLAEMGVGYITVAHLFWRRVATNVPALPFLPDNLYTAMFWQRGRGLDKRGEHLIRAMIDNGIMIDITHMSKKAMAATFALLDALDPGKTLPVMASHTACSYGNFQYNLEEKWVRKIAERKGICGIIYCDHYMRDGRGQQTQTLADSFAIIDGHIAKLRAWGGDDILAIGSDLDGFIKPTLAGLNSAASHKLTAEHLVQKYGEALATKICHGNALRMMEACWRRRAATAPVATIAPDLRTPA